MTISDGDANVRPRLHVQNIFDAVNPDGKGVSGDLARRCLHLEKRAIGLACSGASGPQPHEAGRQGAAKDRLGRTLTLSMFRGPGGAAMTVRPRAG